MDRMSNIVVKLECNELKPLPGAPNVKVVYDTSPRTTTREREIVVLLCMWHCSRLS
jgi:hypothetical protein